MRVNNPFEDTSAELLSCQMDSLQIVRVKLDKYQLADTKRSHIGNILDQYLKLRHSGMPENQNTFNGC